MKKLFLTSGVIACMACPAFATQNPSFSSITSGTANDDCVYDEIGSYSDSATLYAIWQNDIGVITLDDNSTNYFGGAYTTQGDRHTLYGSSTAVFTTQTGQGTTQDPYEYSGNVYGPTAAQSANTTASTVVSSTPVGKQVTLTFDMGNDYVNNTLNGTGGTGGTSTTNYNDQADTTSDYLPFGGFYSQPQDSSSPVQYIDDQGVLTDAGYNAATTATTQTWLAHYDCKTFGLPSTDPSRTGYTFAGWWDSTYSTQITTPQCIEEDATLYAKWTADESTVTYTCGIAQGTSDFATGHSVTGSSGANDTATFTYDHQFYLPTTEGNCQLPGYHFTGWDCGSDLAGQSGNGVYTVSNGTVSGDGGLFKITGNTPITCAATWEANDIAITWDGNHATSFTAPTPGSAGAGTCSYDGDVTLPNEPQRNGYLFQGWSVSEN